LFHADGQQMDKLDEANSRFLQFVNAPKKNNLIYTAISYIFMIF